MTYEAIRTLTQLQSLAWTFPMLALCFAVLWEIRKPTYKSCSNVSDKKEGQMCWILTGLFVSFLGKIAESAWWVIPWTADYLNMPDWKSLHGIGVFVNLVFRQLFFTFAGYCYLRAFVPVTNPKKTLKGLHHLLFCSLVLGQLYIVILFIIKQK
jgi:hypothetical protein